MPGRRIRVTEPPTSSGGRRSNASATSTVNDASRSSSMRLTRCRSTHRATGHSPNNGSAARERQHVRIVRQLVPRSVRHGVSVRIARVHAGRLDRHLAGLASGTDTIVVGPWLGEVGFELLYWVPFVRWFATAFAVAPERLLVISRGGTASWYRPFAARYRDIFDVLTPEEYRRRHDERVAANGEQKQTRILPFEHDLAREATRDVRRSRMLHPASMFSLFNPFWWGHVVDEWVHRRTRFCGLRALD